MAEEGQTELAEESCFENKQNMLLRNRERPLLGWPTKTTGGELRKFAKSQCDR